MNYFSLSITCQFRAPSAVKSVPEVLGSISAALNLERTSSLQTSRQKPVACAYMAAP